MNIHNTIQRHASELEQIHFLMIDPRDVVTGVRQTDKGYILFRPIPLEGSHVVRADCNDLGAVRDELWIMIAHARQLRAAIRSYKAAQKGQDDGFAAAKV